MHENIYIQYGSHSITLRRCAKGIQMKKNIWIILPVSVLVFTILFGVVLQPEATYVKAQYIDQFKLTIRMEVQPHLAQVTLTLTLGYRFKL